MEFQNSLDIFEPGDLTALVCSDVPEVQRLVVDQLSSLNYKMHTGLFIEDVLLKLRAHSYDVVVIAENFAATDMAKSMKIDPHQHLDAPVVLAHLIQATTILCAPMAAGLMGSAVLRDFEGRTHELYFTTRLTRADYWDGEDGSERK